MSHHLVQIEHLGIAVKDIKAGNALYTKLLGVPPYKEEVVESEGVRTSFFKAGPNKIELLEAMNPESPIAKFIEKRGEGIHHVAYAVEDITAEMDRLKSEGFRLSPKRCRWDVNRTVSRSRLVPSSNCLLGS